MQCFRNPENQKDKKKVIECAKAFVMEFHSLYSFTHTKKRTKKKKLAHIQFND